MLQFSRQRPRRSGEWTGGKAVTFIVTLAACRNVTLAARAAGMSRKSAYALKSRDSRFAAAWAKALAASSSRPAASRPQGDKSDKTDNPPAQAPRGHTGLAGPDSAKRRPDETERDLFFASLRADSVIDRHLQASLARFSRLA